MRQRIADAGDLSALSTTDKSSLVAAINEAILSAGVAIDDTAGAGDTDVTYSADRIVAAIQTAIDNLTDVAPAALDTLNELAAALGDDPNFAATIAADVGNRVRYDSAQGLTAAQQLQASQNIGVGDPEADHLATYVTARDA